MNKSVARWPLRQSRALKRLRLATPDTEIEAGKADWLGLLSGPFLPTLSVSGGKEDLIEVSMALGGQPYQSGGDGARSAPVQRRARA